MNSNPANKDHVASSANAEKRAVVEMCLVRITMAPKLAWMDGIWSE